MQVVMTQRAIQQHIYRECITGGMESKHPIHPEVMTTIQEGTTTILWVLTSRPRVPEDLMVSREALG